MDPTATSPPTAAMPVGTEPAVRAVRIDVISGPDAGASLQADRELIVVGTHRSADLVLTDRTVSRFHCELSVDGDAVRLRDLGSRNGTLVDSTVVEQGRLRGPTILTLGKTELRVDLLAETVELELSAQEQFGNLIGVSPAIRRAFELLQKAAERGSNLLIEGEAGTGKDAAAAAVHEASDRADGPLDVVDCGAAALEVEAELFGKRDRAGALERCNGGTVILDDVGALASGTQRALLRAIELRRIRRIGSDDSADVDVRLISLSRGNLRFDVNADRFRSDLFYMLSLLRIRMPPLRERPQDVPLLVSHFLDALGARDGQIGARLLGEESIEQLRAAPWLGNVRELRAYVERTVAGEETDSSEDEAAPPLIDGSVPLRDARKQWVKYFERAYLRDLLSRTGGNVSAAAVIAGVDRVHIHRLITRCGLRDELSRDSGD